MDNEMDNEYFEPVIEEDEEKEKPAPQEDEGVLIEEDGEPEAAPSDKEPGPKAEGADEKIAALEGELASVRADFYNYRQRVMREKQEARRRTKERLPRAVEGPAAQAHPRLLPGRRPRGGPQHLQQRHRLQPRRHPRL